MVPRLPQLDDGVPGLPALDRITVFEVFVMTIPSITVGINQGFHGDDGSRATKFFLVFDGDVLVSPRPAALLGL